MFNQLATTIVEHLIGEAPAVTLMKLAGGTDRTWRTRLKQGWEPSASQRVRHDRHADKVLTGVLQDGGWSAEEAADILAARPSQREGVLLPTADLIHAFSPRFGEYCGGAIALATRFDRDCSRLTEAMRARNTDQARAVLYSMLDWLLSFAADDTGKADEIRGELAAAADTDAMLAPAWRVGEQLLAHVFSRWDLEFGIGYFEEMEPYPLFTLVMPRLAPDIEVDTDTGHILRQGRLPRQRILEPAMARLIDFLGVLTAGYRRQLKRLPERLPRVQDMAAWWRESESVLVSWRDETTRFTLRHFYRLWDVGLELGKCDVGPALPAPVFVFAHLARHLLIRTNGRPTALLDCSKVYKQWWQVHRDRLAGEGKHFGQKTWPAYLIGGAGTTAPDDSLSRQSVGRASHPRDRQ